MKSYLYESPVMDGSYDFSSANSYGREFYKNRIFTLLMQIYGPSLGDLIQKISRISSWLTGRGELVFDDMPLVCWRASVLNSIDYAPERYGKKAVLSVSFEVEPFSECIFDTADGPMIGMALPLSTPIPLETDKAFAFDTDTIRVINQGTTYARPTLIYEAENDYFTYLTVLCSGKMIELYEIPDTEKVIIDLKNHTVIDGEGNNLMMYFKGDFFELAPGENIIASESNAENMKTQVIYKPKFMYDFEWTGGEDDA